MSSATAKYQLSLPFLLQPISPGLAALHASRARFLHLMDPGLASTHCLRCGSFLFDGLGETRLVSRRSKRRKQSEDSSVSVLRKICGRCGYSDEMPVESGNAKISPKPGRNTTRIHGQNRIATGLPDSVATDIQTSIPFSSSANNLMPLRGRDSPDIPNSPSLEPSIPSRPPNLVLSPSASPSPHSQAVSMSTPAAGSARTKTRAKKKPGLQEMLARNREREKKELEKKRDGQADGGRVGLATFLSGL